MGKVIAEWASRYVDMPDDEQLRSKSKVAANLNRSDDFTTKLKLGKHYFLADEPEEYGGSDYGPTPYDYVAGGLAACKAMTVQMYARRKKWDVQEVSVHVDHSKEYAVDCENCEEDKSAKIDTFTCEISFTGDLSIEQKKRLLEIADRCPVHRTLTGDIQIVSSLVE